MVQMNQTVLSH